MTVCVVDFAEFAEFLADREVDVVTSALDGLAKSAHTWVFRESERADKGELALVASVMETSGGKGVLIEDGSGRLADVLGSQVAHIPSAVVSDMGALARLCGIEIGESEPVIETAPEPEPVVSEPEPVVPESQPSFSGFTEPEPIVSETEPVTSEPTFSGFAKAETTPNTEPEPVIETAPEPEPIVSEPEPVIETTPEPFPETEHAPTFSGFTKAPTNTPEPEPAPQPYLQPPETTPTPHGFTTNTPPPAEKTIRDIIAPVSTDKIHLTLPTRTYSRILLVTGAKGGIGKTTLSVAIAQTLASKTAPRTILIDGNRGQGDTSARLHTHPNYPTIYDYANGKPFQKICLEPHQVIRQDENGNPYYTLTTHVPKFSYIQAPHKGTSNANIVTAHTYANVIQDAFERKVDYIVIDTQIAEDTDTSGLFDQLWLPLLQRGAYTVTLVAAEKASAKNTCHTINNWVKNYHINPANIYPVITFTDNWNAQDADAITMKLREAKTPVLGAIPFSPSLQPLEITHLLSVPSVQFSSSVVSNSL